jgi:hypothetical protein
MVPTDGATEEEGKAMAEPLPKLEKQVLFWVLVCSVRTTELDDLHHCHISDYNADQLSGDSTPLSITWQTPSRAASTSPTWWTRRPTRRSPPTGVRRHNLRVRKHS